MSTPSTAKPTKWQNSELLEAHSRARAQTVSRGPQGTSAYMHIHHSISFTSQHLDNVGYKNDSLSVPTLYLISAWIAGHKEGSVPLLNLINVQKA